MIPLAFACACRMETILVNQVIYDSSWRLLLDLEPSRGCHPWSVAFHPNPDIIPSFRRMPLQ